MNSWPDICKKSDIGAELSSCKQFRYLLWRKWNQQLVPMIFIMLNPSTANEVDDDPTIRKCIHFAKSEKCGGIIVVNMFAFRSSDPKRLKQVIDPVGPKNDFWIKTVASSISKTVVAWGTNAAPFNDRLLSIRRLLSENDISLYCLGVSKKGFPLHPLYLKNSTELIEYIWP